MLASLIGILSKTALMNKFWTIGEIIQLGITLIALNKPPISPKSIRKENTPRSYVRLKFDMEIYIFTSPVFDYE